MLTVADYFCGAGGSSTGMEQVPGVRVVMASNHWQLAVDTHHANFPHADHDREDITRIDPRRHPRTDICWFSPECTNWSAARGVKCDYDGKPVQLDLFGQDEDPEPLPDEAAQRSRMLMQDVPRFTEVHRYRAVIVENVTDILKWVHLDAWLTRMRRLGYAHRTVVLNSAFATILGPGAPQLRDRVYFVFWRDHYPTPDFPKWTRPLAWCPACDRDVHAVYLAKPGLRRAMRYGTQYIYRCPQTSCRAAVVHPYCLSAAAAIDWTLPAGRIGDRSKPLRPKTLARIEHGLRRHGSAMLVPSGGTWNSTARPTTTPMRARTTRETEALLVPVEARTGKQARTTADPMRAQTARAQDALVVPLRNTASPGPPRTHPLVTFAAGGTHQGLIMRNNTGGAEMSTPLEEPLRALTTAGHQSLVRWDHLTYAYDTGTMRPVAAPLPTQTAVPGDALIRPTVDVADCTFRMLGVDEIRAGMAFTDG
ncbi:MAG TPA: DNA cytosine methyltransferase [Actinophytocola sp.]|uniref:DNA cytosine methyltransferase n=1 Tax=Actinophytocola sp. TaxID=1872138 RepID=UPI002DFCDECB|nr:DNA cytosine methyltransferase [Actinophytocola sp.]